MSTSTPTAPTSTTTGSVATAASGALASTHGKTTIADTVVSKIAGIAAREVHGVFALGGSASRAVGALRDRIPGASVNHAQGISVEVGEKQAAIDIDIVAEYGVSISDLASGIRRNVIGAIERMTGLEVVEVDITVHDVHLADDTADEDDSSSHLTPGRVMPDTVGDLADDIAALVLATPGVAGLHPGMFGEVATYLPGRKVSGIRVADGVVDVHVIVDAGLPLRSTAATVRAAVASAVPGSTVNVTVEDIEVGSEIGNAGGR